MSRNKKIAKGLGAGVLAVATLASGLSFGAASASATEAGMKPVSDRAIQLVAHYGESSYYYFSGGYAYFTQDLSYAKAHADTLEVVQPAGTQFQLRKRGTDQCLASGFAAAWGTHTVGYTSCGKPSAMTQDDAGNIMFVRPGDTPLYMTTSYYDNGASRYAAASPNRPEQNDFIDTEHLGFSGAVISTDVDARNAVITGHARGGAFVTLSWGDGESAEVQANEDGEWTYELERLKLGKNLVHLEQYVDQQKIGELDLDVELKIADLTVQHEFSADRDDLVTLSGTAQPGAIVQALDGDGTVIVESGKVPASGEWQTKLPAPNTGGAYGFDVVQSYGGEQTGKTAVSVDYGKQLIVTRPTDGFEHPGGALRMTGTGEPGSSISVAEGRRPIGSATVFQSGQWSLNTSDLNAAEHTLTVTQQSKGGNTQTDTITINPGESSVPAPEAKVVFDADVTKKATITGTAEAGATVVIRDAANAQVAKLENVDGTFSADITAPGAGSHDYTVTQMVNFEISEPTTVTADFGAAVTATTPVAATDAKVTISGAGQNGQLVSLTDADGTVQSTTVSGGTWSLTGAFRNGTTPVEVTGVSKGALTTKATVTVTVNQVRKALTIDTPTKEDADNGAIKQGPVTFTGTATPFAQITMELWRGSGIRLTATADGAGNWSGIANVGDSTYTPIFTQTVLGSSNEVVWHTFSTIGYQNLNNVRPNVDDFVQPSRIPFTGKATQGSKIEIWTGPKDASWARKVASTTAQASGVYGVSGALSANTTYTLYTYQTAGTNSDMVITTINTGAELKTDIVDLKATSTGQTTVFTGKANPNVTVELWTGPKDSWGVKRFEAKADHYGHFTTPAGYLTPGNAYNLHGYQQWNGTYLGNTLQFAYTPPMAK